MSFRADLKTAIVNNFAAAQRTQIANAFASAPAYNYQPTINGAPNPQSKIDFAVEKIAEHIRDVVKSEELKALQTAVVAPIPIPIT